MRKFFQIFTVSLLVTSCDFIGKTKQIVEFTPSLADLHRDISHSPVVIDHVKDSVMWSDATNIANIQPHNISVLDLDFLHFLQLSIVPYLDLTIPYSIPQPKVSSLQARKFSPRRAQ